MKLNLHSLLTSLKTSSKKKKKTSHNSHSSSFHSLSSSSSDLSSRLRSTPTSILPPSRPLHDLFTLFDQDGDGKITKQELSDVLRRLAPFPPTADEVASMVADVDRDGDGCISLEEFGALGAAALGPPPAGADDEDDLREAFAVFDADGDGKISAEELLQVFLALGDGGCTIDECRRMIGGVDSDGDGFVGFQDFARMMDGQRLC